MSNTLRVERGVLVYTGSSLRLVMRGHKLPSYGGGELTARKHIMCFDRILKIIDAIMPLITVVVSCCFAPSILDWWRFRKVRSCYNSLLSYFNKFCHNLGGIGICTIRESYFENDSDIEMLINEDKNNPAFTDEKNWGHERFCQIVTALNTARSKIDLESGKFYFSRYFINNSHGELLVVLTVNGNTANMQAFCRGKWILPASKGKSKLHKLRIKLFGYPSPEYSIMLV